MRKAEKRIRTSAASNWGGAQLAVACRALRSREPPHHARLIDLCESRMKRDAVKLLRDHIAGVRDDLLNYINEHHG